MSHGSPFAYRTHVDLIGFKQLMPKAAGFWPWDPGRALGSCGEGVIGQMSGENPPRAHVAAPGTERPRRFRPKLRYELIGGGLHGHETRGREAADRPPEDEIFPRDSGGRRWYRCMRCDSWLALAPPSRPARKYPPEREEISLPLRGKPLRDRYVLRLIAVDRILHFLVLGRLAAA